MQSHPRAKLLIERLNCGFWSAANCQIEPFMQAAQRHSDDAAVSGQLLAERDAQIERLSAQLAGYKEDRDLEVEALTEERDRLDAALAVRSGLLSQG